MVIIVYLGWSTKLQDKGKLLIILLLVAWVISSIVALYYFRLDFTIEKCLSHFKSSLLKSQVS